MILCDDPSKARIRALRARPSPATKPFPASEKPGDSRGLADCPDSASRFPKLPRMKPRLAFCLGGRLFRRRFPASQAEFPGPDAPKTRFRPSRLPASKGWRLKDLSLSLITGLPGDLASAQDAAAKGSQRSLNQAWLTIGSGQVRFGAIVVRGNLLVRRPGRRKQCVRVEVSKE